MTADSVVQHAPDETRGGLADRHGRVATDLRVSLTDRCNLRCQYCMPAEGLDWMPTDETLTDDEVVRLVTIGVEQLGITDVRFTGGEPLLRRGLVDIVSATKALSPAPTVSLTSNGLGLKHTAQALAAAGLDRVNISLDTIRPETFERITRRNRHADVVAAAQDAAGCKRLKVASSSLGSPLAKSRPSRNRWLTCAGNSTTFHGFRLSAPRSLDYG